MTLEKIRELLHGSERFVLHMVSGRVFDIPHPDFVALSRSETYLIIAGERERVECVRINQIESVDIPATKSD
ncbi:MAG TPA: hypothetical protein VG838_11595 [Opitutaceae bacterium]|nr:hypothetical protein [Opitutaceae bacterium]